MPYFAVFFLVGCLGNLGLPGTCNFIGELLLFFSVVSKNVFVFLIMLSSVVFAAMYSLYLYSRLFYGNLTRYIDEYLDTIDWDYYMALPLVGCIIGFGLIPNFILDLLIGYSYLIAEKAK